MSTKTKNNKVYVTENTLIFEDSNVKIITGVADADVDSMIGDQTITPGDLVISTEGTLYVRKDNNTFGDLSAGGGGGGADTDLGNLTSPTAINQHLLPNNTLTHNLGSFGLRYDTAFLGNVNVLTTATLNGGASMQGQLITNVADPSTAQDAATKAYVDENAPVKAKYSFTYTDFSGEPGTIAELPLFTLPAKGIIEEIVIITTTTFTNSGGNSSIAYVAQTGLSPTYASHTLDAPVSGTDFARQSPPDSILINMSSPTNIVVVLENDGGTGGLATLTDGAFDVYIEYKLLAD